MRAKLDFSDNINAGDKRITEKIDKVRLSDIEGDGLLSEISNRYKKVRTGFSRGILNFVKDTFMGFTYLGNMLVQSGISSVELADLSLKLFPLYFQID